MNRKRSVVWSSFKTVDSDAVQCLLCGYYLLRRGHGTTTPLLRHLRLKHSAGAVRKSKRRGAEAASVNGHRDMETDSQQFCSVEVALEDSDSNTLTTGNDINSAIKTIMESASPAEQIMHVEAGDNRPMRGRRSLIWRHYEHLDSLSVARCRICMKKLKCSEGGSTSNLHRHMSKKHPVVFSQLVANGQKKPPPSPSSQGSNANSDTSTPPEAEKRQVKVKVALEDGDSDTLTTEKEADINSANSILEAASSADCPVRQTRNKRSLIWRHYERLDSLSAARCRICMKKLQCFEGGSTSNLHRHMSKRHPEVLSRLVGNEQSISHSSQSWNVNGNTSTLPETNGATEKRQFSGVFKRESAGEKRGFRREQELIEALRRAQREEARALQDQRELLEKLRAANAREAAAERVQIEALRKAQLEEAKNLSREKAEVEKEKAALQKMCEELQQEREEFLLFSRGQQTS